MADASKKGARLACGGKGHAPGPRFYDATVLIGIPVDARIMPEEAFGSVAPITPFDTKEEVAARRNTAWPR